ncbi:efflux RND transporter periplasmic adaptor subunit [Bosea sp. (in: a-proteobacteria)]|jgi:membrane fusion protein (multidrug efflux system)|uniref:efflux RND transporter periplasmic adaptor subunit n=1 Tax=Bosea sp. (in: a-proteobacteria) TaxID=1871050 RepID=UPI00086EAFFD|nr:efflux RND transporter periplasmic adaptor subunit [Bosea sp. (in: a-proteobacteria)]MBN9436488.1 efflux RND transporter periplasmic adaptor subunit [Bosea sp. (in: a-proteobacteria)]ODT54336.1 MAG: efflux transporter periplasmic adaptor subunit [Methylobacterium sp. SCN 67-24]
MTLPISHLGRGLLLGVLLLTAACSEEKKPAQGAAAQRPPVAIGVITAEPQTLPVTNNLPGRIAPTRIAEVRPRVSGIVVERVFQQGSMVKQGDVLYRIDPAPFRVRVASAEAALKRAEASQLQARQHSDRIVELLERKVASTQQQETAVAQLAQADADVAAARAGLDAAQLDLEYSEVRAPISGRIGRALITEGALVGTGAADILATIQQLDPVYADFTQSAGELLALRQALKLGALTGPNPGAANVQLLFDNGATYKHRGQLLFSEATVDVTTGQVTLRGQFPNPEGDLLPGMYVRVVLEQGAQSNAIAVPLQAIQRDGSGQAQLYVLKADGTLELLPVRAGRTLDNRQVIEDGLKPGDQVVVEGFQKIRPGAKFTGMPWKPAAADPAAATEKQG